MAPDVPQQISWAVYEYTEINEYVRGALEVYVHWFTFFITILLGAMGWTLKVAFERSARLRLLDPFFVIAGLFIVQLAMSIWATHHVHHDFLAANARLEALANVIRSGMPGSLVPMSPMPPAIPKATFIMGITLATNFFLWATVAIYLAKNRAYFEK